MKPTICYDLEPKQGKWEEHISLPEGQTRASDHHRYVGKKQTNALFKLREERT